MSQTSNQLSPPYRLILDSLNEGSVIPFLGAGASLSRDLVTNSESQEGAQENLPTAAELAQHLADKTDFPEDEIIDLAKVAQYYSLIGGRTPLNRALHKIFDRDFPLTPLHNFLANIDKPLLIVTTNYDDLIERAFNERGRLYDIVIHTSDPKLGDRLLWLEHGADHPIEISPNRLQINLQKVTVIYKMHGAVDRHHTPDRDQYVITEDDYIDFLARMTKNKAIPANFAEPFQACHFLFLGYSLRDWNLRVLLNRIQDSRRFTDLTSWGIQDKPSVMERRFWQKRGVEVYDMPLDDFVRELSAHI